MSDNDNLVRYLQSAAFLQTNDQQITYYVHTNEGNLIEKAFDGGEWSLPTLIAKVPRNAPAVYIQGRDKRGIVTLVDGLLRNYLYLEDDDEWVEGSLVLANIKTDLDSQLAAGITKNGNFRIFYESEDGNLGAATSIDGFEWHKNPTYFNDAKLLDGTPLWYIASEKQPEVLFYQSTDGYIHYVEEIDGNPVSDTALPGGQVEVGVKITRILAQNLENVYYLTSEGKIFQATPKGKMHIGTADQVGNFKASSSAECFLFRRPFRPFPPRYIQNTNTNTNTNININQTYIQNNYYINQGSRNPW